MYKMNASVVCPSCSLAVCSCSAVVVAPVYDASAVIMKECVVCYDEKPETDFLKYGFRCSCSVGKEKLICDACIDNIKKCKNNCPTCRKSNFAYLIRNMLGAIDWNFSFECELPVFSYDGSFNTLSYTEKQNATKSHLKTCFEIFALKNSDFYDKVYSVMEDEYLTRGTQTFFNLWNFINEYIFKSYFTNLTDKEKFNKFFILDTDIESGNFNDMNNLKMCDFMGTDDFDPFSTSFFIYVNASYDKWEKYRFSFDTRDRIMEMVDDEMVNNIAYHDHDDLIRHLRQSTRYAFNADSHFWVVARENEMNDEILAIIERDDYQTHLVDDLRYFNYIMTNPDEGYCDCLCFDDHNEVFEDYDNDVLQGIFHNCEYMETFNVV